ncbi:zinc finger and SCAN domain-containing protein 5A-like isoform X2 [Pseudoliparis swirei]|uniref:zinc finger and SCAN domain-containing protein 5A-like isoform X2 n=1 Tax=Pseudoliparis swirei TaxID=2059687 RepID=UPI0024BE04C6|nr:zinc finger and SCAN domain-containing protein 5A-like isoform X2 [Pseudoliparis swirei]XP_056296246.1 zinc finger and SCAN domain-containing protein 5A-like isoform X2 [Pseudoliparis swirei]
MAAYRCKGRGVDSGHVGVLAPQPSPEDNRRLFKTLSPKQKTMESARSAFHAQLAAVMDSLLAAAVCEIAKVFEGSLCEQQAELKQRTEEIFVLRGKLEKVERRHRAKGEGSEEGEMSSGHREGGLRQQTLAASGLNGGKEMSSHLNPEGGLSSQSLSGLKEEVTSQHGTSVKHERAGSRPSLGSVAAQVPDRSVAAGDQRPIGTLSGTQAKVKSSHWDQDGADHRPLQDQASTPFLSISQSGRCSPRPDPSLAQPGEWLPGLNGAQDGVSGLENLQPDGTSCSGPASSSTGTDTPCFRPGFASDETSNEDDDGSFPFLDQEPENHNANQNSVQGQGGEQRGAREVQPQAPSGESPWRPRDDRGGRGPINHTRRLTTLGNRDPLRPQSNSQLLTLRHANTLSHPPAPGGGSGRPYTCPYCTKCFTYPSHQRRHLLRHTGVRLHPCQFCDKSFLTPSELTVHTRTHTGERPFGCAQCGKRFARSGNLRAHQRDVHMGKRPFACTECGKRFAHRGNLRVHNHRVHQGDPYYTDEQPEPDIGPNPI